MYRSSCPNATMYRSSCLELTTRTSIQKIKKPQFMRLLLYRCCCHPYTKSYHGSGLGADQWLKIQKRCLSRSTWLRTTPSATATPVPECALCLSQQAPLNKLSFQRTNNPATSKSIVARTKVKNLIPQQEEAPAGLEPLLFFHAILPVSLMSCHMIIQKNP